MRVLFVGYGSIARKHHDALKQLFDDKLTCFALRSRRQSIDINGVQSISDWDQIPMNIDFAIVSTPTSNHVDSIKELIKRKIPIFLEKPISHTLGGLTEINREISTNNIPNYVACNLRFLPALLFLKEVISKRRLEVNEVNVYAGSYLPDWRPGIDYTEGYSAKADMGGGVHLDLFHELDYTYWIFGNPNYTTNLKRKNSSLAISSFDFAAYQFVYEGFVASITLNYYRRKTKRSMEIVFDNEIWLLDLLTDTIVNENGEVIFSEASGVKETYVSQMKYFTDCILSKETPSYNTFSESFEVLKICLQNEIR